MGFQADGISPDDKFTGSRFVLNWGPVGEIPCATVAERAQPTRKATASDGTGFSMGETDPVDVDITIPLGNDAVRVALRSMYEAGQGRVMPGYKADAYLTMATVTEGQTQTETWRGAWLSGNTRPALDKTSGAPTEEARETFTFTVDKVEVQNA